MTNATTFAQLHTELLDDFGWGGQLNPRFHELRAVLGLDAEQSGPEQTLRARFTEFLRNWEGDGDLVL